MPPDLITLAALPYSFSLVFALTVSQSSFEHFRSQQSENKYWWNSLWKTGIFSLKRNLKNTNLPILLARLKDITNAKSKVTSPFFFKNISGNQHPSIHFQQLVGPIPAVFGKKVDSNLNWSPISRRVHVETNNNSHPQPHSHWVGDRSFAARTQIRRVYHYTTSDLKSPYRTN